MFKDLPGWSARLALSLAFLALFVPAMALALNSPTVVVNSQTLSSSSLTILGSTPSAVVITFDEDIITPPTVKDGLPSDSFASGATQTVTDCGDGDAKTFCFSYVAPAGIDNAFRYFQISDAQNAALDTLAPATYRFIADTVGPTITITSSNTSHSGFPTISGTSDDGSAIGVAIDNSALGVHQYYSTVGHSWSLTVPSGSGLAQGSYTVTASSTDPYGNHSNTATQTLTLDNSPPAITMLTGPLFGYASSSLVAFTFSVTDADSFTVTCSFEHETPSGCTAANPIAASKTLSEGSPRTFAVVATDSFSNQSSITVTFAVDLTAPVLAITTTTASSSTPTIQGTSSDTALVTIGINNKTYSATPAAGIWSLTLPGADALTDGSYTIMATSTDAAGNTGTATGSITIDTTAPVVSVPSIGSYASSTTVSVAFTATDTHLSSTSCAYDGQVAVACSSPFATSTLAEGSHTLVVSATDSFGNTASSSTTFIKDSVAPVLAEVSPIATSANTTPSYSFTSTEPGSISYGGSCSSLTTAAIAGTTTVTFSTLAVGTYSNCTVAVRDTAGNTGTLTVTTFEINTVPPPPHPGGGSVGNGPPVENKSQGLPQGLILGTETNAVQHASDKAKEIIQMILPPAKVTPPSTPKNIPAANPKKDAFVSFAPQPPQQQAQPQQNLAATAIGANTEPIPVMPLLLALVLLATLGTAVWRAIS